MEPISYHIIETVCYWLGYQFSIGRDHLVHEASLRYPIADTITAKTTEISDIVLENPHPFFKRRRMDLTIFDTGTSSTKSRKFEDIKEVYEFKLAKSGTGDDGSEEHQRVFDDIVRLAYLHKWGRKDCYFLMCGEIEDFKTFFVGQAIPKVKKEADKNIVNPSIAKQPSDPSKFSIKNWDPNGLYSDWFKFIPKGVQEKEFKADNENWGLKVFQSSYDRRDPDHCKYSDSIKVKTTCINITPVDYEHARTHAAGIWKIESI